MEIPDELGGAMDLIDDVDSTGIRAACRRAYILYRFALIVVGDLWRP
ncbi:hypothetical protein CFIICLFH_1945 [Methylobacterium goesingense]|uniref:Uncharacterized protein n=1 Tax=Methylobacterium goesingense TaxID=243690 RepID=A0ABV2L1Z4_9HYPH|nr:hypothetical protein CFIICLFH_1945 [Methylobacterium goesingense]